MSVIAPGTGSITADRRTIKAYSTPDESFRVLAMMFLYEEATSDQNRASVTARAGFSQERGFDDEDLISEIEVSEAVAYGENFGLDIPLGWSWVNNSPYLRMFRLVYSDERYILWLNAGFRNKAEIDALMADGIDAELAGTVYEKNPLDITPLEW